VVTATTALEGARLAINHIPIQAVCQDCDTALAPSAELRLVCGACGSRPLRIEAGEEFLVRSIDIASGTT
jgi:Zn finger protein HypA/HybF involved in hydrogenase expression